MRFAFSLVLSFGLALGSPRVLSAQDGQAGEPLSEAPAFESCEARVAGFEQRAEVDRRKVNALISARDALQRQLDDCAAGQVPEADLDRANVLLDALEARLTEIEASLE